MIEKVKLVRWYVQDKKSTKQISHLLKCSENKVTYWLQKHQIAKRSIADAMYARYNPHGHPFAFQQPRRADEWFLYGLGLGLFWGEGNKVNRHSVRLGNADPALIKTFLRFLREVYHIDESKLRFGIQVFSDVAPEHALSFWRRQLGVPKSAFSKVVVTPSRRTGTYRKKSQYGVLTVYFSNVKLRDIIVSAIEELRKIA